MTESKPQRAVTIHDEYDTEPDAYRSYNLSDAGQWYVLNLVLSDMHGAYMPLIQSGPHASYDAAYQQGEKDNVRAREEDYPPEYPSGPRETVRTVMASRAFSIQNLTTDEVVRFQAREQWLLEPMIVPQKDEQGHVTMRTMERPYA